MPDEVVTFLVLHEGDHTESIEESAAKDHDEQPQIVLEHAGYEKKTAPSDNEIECHMDRHESGRAEYADEGDAQQDQSPLDAEHDYALCVAPIDKTEGREGASDQKIDRGIVETSPKLLDKQAALPGMVKAAHGKQQDQADPVETGSHDLQAGIGFQKQKDKAGN